MKLVTSHKGCQLKPYIVKSNKAPGGKKYALCWSLNWEINRTDLMMEKHKKGIERNDWRHYDGMDIRTTLRDTVSSYH